MTKFQPGNSIGKRFEAGNTAYKPFPPGNEMSLTHGAKSQMVINSRLPGEVEAIRAAMTESIPGLQPIDNMVLVQLARTWIELTQYQEHQDSKGGKPFDSRGRPRQWWRDYNAVHARFMKYCSMLGISPAGRASLMRDAGAGQRDWEAAEAQRELRAKYVTEQVEVIDGD